MKLRELITLLLIASSSILLAQKDSLQRNHYSIGLGTGIDFIQNRDQFMSPLVYKGFGFPIIINAHFGFEKWEHFIDISGTSSVLTNAYDLKTRHNTKLDEWHQFNLNYRLFYSLSSNNDNFGFKHAVGGSFDPSFFYRGYPMLGGESWEFIGGLGASYKCQFDFNKKHSFSALLNIPLLSFIHRPDHTFDEQFFIDLYEGNSILKYGKIKFVGDQNFRYGLEFHYNYFFHERWFLNVRVMTNYYQINFPQKSQSVIWSGCATINFKL